MRTKCYEIKTKDFRFFLFFCRDFGETGIVYPKNAVLKLVLTLVFLWYVLCSIIQGRKWCHQKGWGYCKRQLALYKLRVLASFQAFSKRKYNKKVVAINYVRSLFIRCPHWEEWQYPHHGLPWETIVSRTTLGVWESTFTSKGSVLVNRLTNMVHLKKN